MALLHVSELPPQRAKEAFSLARLGCGTEAAQWRALLEPDGGAQHGMLCATAMNGVLLGLASYRLVPDSAQGKALHVALFVAFELGGKTLTRDALRDALYQQCERWGCGAILFAKDSRGLGTTGPG